MNADLKTGLCSYRLGWKGECGLPADGYRCPAHAQERCRCGAPATHECQTEVSDTRCGVPACDHPFCSHPHRKKR